MTRAPTTRNDLVRRRFASPLDSKRRGLENVCMKASIEIPDAVMQHVRQRAAVEGRAVEDVVTELLAASPATAAENGQPVAKTLPLLKVRVLSAVESYTPQTQEWCDRIKDAEVRLEVERYEKAFGRKHKDRADS